MDDPREDPLDYDYRDDSLELPPRPSRRPKRKKRRKKRRRLREMPPEIERVYKSIRVFGLLLGLFCVLLLLGGVIGLLKTPEPDDPPKWFAMLLIPFGLFGAITSEATRNKKRWALDYVWIFAILWLLAFPVGTIMGGYILYNFRSLKPYYG